MKKEFSKAVSLMLFLALAVGMTAGGATEAKSAPKLSPKKLSVEVGSKKSIKVKNTKNKASWSIKSGKKNISLSAKKKASVVVKGKKAGKAKERH